MIARIHQLMKSHFLVMILIFMLSSCSDGPPKTLEFPEGLEQIYVGEVKENLCLDCDKKMVGYFGLQTGRSTNYLMLISKSIHELKEKNEDLPVIFVFGGQHPKGVIDKDYLLRVLEKIDFPYPVLYDRDDQFYKLNKLENYPQKKDIQIYLVEKNLIHSEAAPGIPGFDKQIKDFLE